MSGKRKLFILLAIATGLLLYLFSLPKVLFNDPYSTVLEARNQNLLSASIASDGQWRFPEGERIPEKFKEAIILFEDKRFYSHPGVDPLSIGRAAQQNLKAGKIISGGSTLSMQVIRLARKNKNRTIFEKVIEIVLATRLELRYSKEEILGLYAAHAPFGGNVVGLESACWRYFGRAPDDLSWSEAALLAVLPNNPSLIHLGKNRQRLMEKRNHLLDRISKTEKFDELTLHLAKSEPIPKNPLPLPRIAPHLLDRVISEGKAGQKIVSTLDQHLQTRTLQIIQDHHQRLKANQVFNAAALVVEVKTGNVLAYVGNTQSGQENNQYVDVIKAPRSTGSILKPFLFAAMLDEGKMLQHALLPDVPTIINGFSPRNFSKEYDGAVAADKALIRSLNIPAVHELREYRYEKFYELLKNLGLTTLNQPADHYGLSLILGGAEGNLWDITGGYASMARTLNNYFDQPGKKRYNKKDFHAPSYNETGAELGKEGNEIEENSWLSAASIYFTFDALKEVYRPGEGTGWKYFSSSKKIAWKTGTSFGFRDGWAVGVNPDYAVGIWVGNADGEGRPGLTGTETAAPILFDVFSSLPGNSWFKHPVSEMENISVCRVSGQRATEHCDLTDKISVTHAGLQTQSCSYHKKIHLSIDHKYRVHSECASISEIYSANWFVLPPVQEYYFKSKNLSYKLLPPFRADCINPSAIASMELIYPKANARIFVPRELNNEQGSTVFEVAHRNPTINVYWHLDGNFVGTTRRSHKIVLSPSAGRHTLSLVDENGETLQREFRVISGI
ncbi:MAG: penicillin-binding protein 1C [Bacteroidia bacterium]|nr:penicillin-binding protein 1C [Bacteroidia bacterium]